MNKVVLALGASIGALAFATSAFAHDMDTDKDGLYSLAEMRTEYADLSEAQYAELDTNKDGAVDPEELAAAIAKGILESME
ncbi:MAG: hypothetical protein C0524_12950 [Rhodobacter sp.]|nr:hypothetical protein [Rhodobacter sp.]